MFRVSSTSATRPVARVRYHSGVVEVTTMAPGSLMLCFPLASGTP